MIQLFPSRVSKKSPRKKNHHQLFWCPTTISMNAGYLYSALYEAMRTNILFEKILELRKYKNDSICPNTN